MIKQFGGKEAEAYEKFIFVRGLSGYLEQILIFYIISGKYNYWFSSDFWFRVKKVFIFQYSGNWFRR